MVSQQLLDYVKKELTRGVSKDKLRQVLLENDWPEFEINEAFEQAKQPEQVKPAEKPPKEVSKETTPVEKPKGIIPEERSVEVKKISVIEDVKKIVTNKIFIIAVAIIILGSIAFFILPSVLEGEEGIEGDSSVMEEAKKACMQYCNNNRCDSFLNPEFPQPGLEDKTCSDLGVKCSRC